MRHLALAVLLFSFGARAAGAESPVRVYVFAHQGEQLSEPARKERIKETEAEHDRAEAARKSLQKSLASRHGKDTKAWPPEARQEVSTAYGKEYAALIANHQAKTEPEALAGFAGVLGKTVAELTKKQSQVAVVESREAADLTVELLARRAKTSFPAAAWFLYLTVKPERMDAARFTGTSFGQVRKSQTFIPILGLQSMGGAITTFHDYSEAEPYWTIEVGHQGTGYYVAIEAAAEALVAFASGVGGSASADAGAVSH